MAIFTFDDLYVISFTDTVKGTISIPVNSFISDAVDIILVGKSKLEYGDEFNENILHILENFACPQNPSPVIINTIEPDSTQANPPAFDNPIQGEFWFNKTDKRLYSYNAASWDVVKNQNDIQGNRGVIVSGQQIPLPSGISSYDECSWFVSPQYIDKRSIYLDCYTDQEARVFVHYRSIFTGEVIEGVANYMIIGIKNSDTNFLAVTMTPTPSIPVNSPTVTRTVTPTPTPSFGATVTPSPTVSTTPTTTVTPTFTPTSSVTRTVTPTLSRTPTPSSVTFQTFTLNSEFFPALPPAIPDTFGAVPNNLEIGSISPGSFTKNGSSYFIERLATIRTAPGSTPFIFQVALSNNTEPPTNLLTKISFTDKDGIFRVFNFANASVSTTIDGSRGIIVKTWSFLNQPSSLFTSGQFIVLIE